MFGVAPLDGSWFDGESLDSSVAGRAWSERRTTAPGLPRRRRGLRARLAALRSSRPASSRMWRWRLLRWSFLVVPVSLVVFSVASRPVPPPPPSVPPPTPPGVAGPFSVKVLSVRNGVALRVSDEVPLVRPRVVQVVLPEFLQRRPTLCFQRLPRDRVGRLDCSELWDDFGFGDRSSNLVGARVDVWFVREGSSSQSVARLWRIDVPDVRNR